MRIFNIIIYTLQDDALTCAEAKPQKLTYLRYYVVIIIKVTWVSKRQACWGSVGIKCYGSQLVDLRYLTLVSTTRKHSALNTQDNTSSHARYFLFSRESFRGLIFPSIRICLVCKYKSPSYSRVVNKISKRPEKNTPSAFLVAMQINQVCALGSVAYFTCSDID